MGKGIVTVKGVKIDMAKIREVSERKLRRKIHLLTPIPEKKVERIEVKKEEIKKEVFSTVLLSISVTIYDHVPIVGIHITCINAQFEF